MGAGEASNYLVLLSFVFSMGVKWYITLLVSTWCFFKGSLGWDYLRVS